MKSLIGKFLVCLSAAAFWFASAAPASAQQAAKPVVVVSISSLNELFGDIAAMTELAGQGDFGRIAVGMGGIYTGGLDKTRPAGVVVALEGQEPKAIAFLPVTNLKQFLGTYREQIGSPRDAGNGVLEIGADRPQPIYVKEQGGWAFVAQSATQLQNLPKDPVALLGGLDKQYDLAVQVNMSAVPPELRDLAVSEMKQGYQRGLEIQAQNLGEEERKQAELVGQAMMQSMTMFIEETETLTFGFAIDGQSKKTFMEAGITARPGTPLAKVMNGYGKTTSNLHGFVLPNAAGSAIAAAPFAPSDIEQGLQLLKAGRQQVLKAIDDDASLPDAKARDGAKEIANTLFDVLAATLEKGKLDLAGSLALGSKSLTFVGGVGVVGGDKIEAALKKLIALAGSSPDLPEVKFNTGVVGGVNLHKVIVPIKDGDRQVRDVFGDQLELVLGTAKNGLYLAFGKDGEATLGKAVTDSAGQADKVAPPAEMKLALSPVLQFASSLEADPQLAIAAAAAEKFAGKDHIIVNSRSVDGGFFYRLEIEEGVIQFVGEAVKAAQAAQQGN